MLKPIFQLLCHRIFSFCHRMGAFSAWKSNWWCFTSEISCAQDTDVPANWRPTENIIHSIFPFWYGKYPEELRGWIFLLLCWWMGSFCGLGEVKLTLYNGHFLSEAPSHHPKYQPIIRAIKINPLKKVNSKIKSFSEGSQQNSQFSILCWSLWFLQSVWSLGSV